MSGKTIGATTLASTGGGAIGFFVAQFFVDVFHLQLTDGGQMGLGLLLLTAGGLLGGFLSPSKREELSKVFAEVNVPTATEIATETAQEISGLIPSSSEVAQKVAEVTPSVDFDSESVAKAVTESLKKSEDVPANVPPASVAPRSVAASKVEYSSGSLDEVLKPLYTEGR